MNTYIYHYTHLKAAIAIAESSFFKLSQWEIGNNVEHPALWLSLHPHWESIEFNEEIMNHKKM